MTTPRISASIQAVYRDFHGGEHGGGAQRSELDAIDKAANIQRLCARVPHDSVLEIGAGDGAVLERLSAGRFGNRYAAVEISEPGCAQSRLPAFRMQGCSMVPHFPTRTRLSTS